MFFKLTCHVFILIGLKLFSVTTIPFIYLLIVVNMYTLKIKPTVLIKALVSPASLCHLQEMTEFNQDSFLTKCYYRVHRTIVVCLSFKQLILLNSVSVTEVAHTSHL